MPDIFSSLIVKKLRNLCHRISSLHHLDPEAERTLYAGMEDKLRTYLSGAEKITEEDAFVLVREHFGDPEKVKKMLVDVHAEAVRASMLRRIGAITVVFLGMACMTILVSFTLYSLLNALHFMTYFSYDSVFVRFAKLIPTIIVYTCAIVMLVVWREREHDARPPWYIRSNPWYFVPASLVLFFLIVFYIFFPIFLHPQPPPSFWVRFSLFWGTDFPYDHYINPVVDGILWIWWLTGAHRKVIGFFTGLFGWMIYKCCMNIYSGFLWILWSEPHQLFAYLPRLLDPRNIGDPRVMMMGIIAAVSFLILYYLRAAGDKAINSIRSSRKEASHVRFPHP